MDWNNNFSKKRIMVLLHPWRVGNLMHLCKIHVKVCGFDTVQMCGELDCMPRPRIFNAACSNVLIVVF